MSLLKVEVGSQVLPWMQFLAKVLPHHVASAPWWTTGHAHKVVWHLAGVWKQLIIKIFQISFLAAVFKVENHQVGSTTMFLQSTRWQRSRRHQQEQEQHEEEEPHTCGKQQFWTGRATMATKWAETQSLQQQKQWQQQATIWQVTRTNNDSEHMATTKKKDSGMLTWCMPFTKMMMEWWLNGQWSCWVLCSVMTEKKMFVSERCVLLKHLQKKS